MCDCSLFSCAPKRQTLRASLEAATDRENAATLHADGLAAQLQHAKEQCEVLTLYIHAFPRCPAPPHVLDCEETRG
jgi:hypothetical protein